MYLKKSGFICLNVYINLPYLYSIDILRKGIIEKKTNNYNLLPYIM